MATNAIGLLPEVLLHPPTTNDDAQHLLFIQDANEALSAGANPFEFWVSEMDEGFPEFLYYQNLPHLSVVLLHRLLFGLVDIGVVFALVKYVLLVTFPLTVFWSLRRIDVAPAPAAVAAGASSLLSTNFLYGFDYDSYLWRGFGLYTQLWAMHLTFIAIAALWRLVRHGTGVRVAALAIIAMGLVHLLYAYMLVVTTAVLLVTVASRQTIVDRFLRLAAAGAIALLATAWMWLPYVLQREYLNVSPYLQPEKLTSYGAPTILGWLVTGQLTDFGRPPVLLALLAAGVASAVWLRTAQARLALGLFVVWLVLYFGPQTLGPLGAVVPLRETLLAHRFIGGVHTGAILLFAMAGAGAWRLLDVERSPRRLVAAAATLAVLLTPALVERKAFADLNATWMRETREHIDADADLRVILDEIRGRPGRVYAGLRTTWGDHLGFGIPFRSVHVYQYLTAQRFRTVSPPFGGASLNSDAQFDFNEQDPGHYDLFDVRWVVAPADEPMPSFLGVEKRTTRYTLYTAPSGGHASYVSIVGREAVKTPAAITLDSRPWLASAGPARRAFLRYDYPAATQVDAELARGCEGGGAVLAEEIASQRMRFSATCPSASAFVIKETYHPNWEVRVDGAKADTFMVSPSFIGLVLPPGEHVVTAEYRSTPRKTPLLVFSVVILVALAAWPRVLRTSPSLAARLGRLSAR